MADDEASTGTESSPSQWTGLGTQQQNPLVAVTFQKNPNRKQKFLEAEPKALGITQIGLCVYQISWFGVSFSNHISTDMNVCIFYVILSLPVIIAGSLAIAAQNLHIPTLRACLGMQVLSCLASIINTLFSAASMVDHPDRFCWDSHIYDYYDNETSWKQWTQSQEYTTCRQLRDSSSHLYAGFVLIQTALVAISGTLASYCCKVVNCCSPAPKMPVITVQACPAQQ